MRPTLHPRLVNGRFGDPAIFVQALHRPEAVLFDLGDLARLGARDLLRVGHICVSHMHMDHFVGFDRLLRVHIGREKRLTIFGPEGIADAVWHKLQAYSWDLVDSFANDLLFEVIEIGRSDELGAFRYRLKAGFAKEKGRVPEFAPGPAVRLPDFILQAAILEHHGPSLGFSLQEPLHVNIWKVRLQESGLAPGDWLQVLKRHIRNGDPDETLVALPDGVQRSLGSLRHLVTVERGQKIAYVTDVADTPMNRRAIEQLARHADTLFIEASFSAADRAQAVRRAHLTTTAAGEIARAAGVRRVEPFHFSPRYEGEEQRMLAEVEGAFEKVDHP